MPNFNYLTNSLEAAKKFAKSYVANIQSGVKRKPWGFYQSEYGSAKEYIKQTIKNPAETAAAATLDVLTNATRRDIWKYTNVHRMLGETGQYVGPRLGVGTAAGLAVAAAVPVVAGALSGQIGSPLQGFRPAGYKSVVPKSKEEDPSGKQPINVGLEAGMRYGLGQRSKILGYQDFKQERPDVLPSTYTHYRRYEYSKPKPGSLVQIDPEGQSFTALGGVVRGSAKGLNDPELRIKGVPVTASAALGVAAGLGAIKATSSYLNKRRDFKGVAPGEISKMPVPTSEKISNALGNLQDPAVLGVGLTAAALTGLAAKKVMQKAIERKVKKENPVEYLKHKHGSLQEAAQALGQPGARSWQELTQHVK